MSVAARLGGFTVVLALVFAAAAFAGSRIDAHPGRQADPRADEPAMGAMRARAEMAPQPVRGLAVSDDGLTLRLARAAATPGKPFESPSASSIAAGRPCATSTSSTPSACTSSSCGAT